MSQCECVDYDWGQCANTEAFPADWSPSVARTGTYPFGSLGPTYNWEAGGQDRQQTFEECLVAHGKTLNSGYPTRYLFYPVLLVFVLARWGVIRKGW